MLSRKTYILFIAVISLTLVGCQGDQLQGPKATSTKQGQESEVHIKVVKPTPSTRPLHSETLDVRNCETTEDLHKSLDDFLQAQKEVSLEEQATAPATGDTIDIPEAKSKVLSGEVQSAFQQEYRQAQAGLKEAEINVPADKIYMYQIQWVEKTYQGTVSFPMENEEYQTSYTYKLKVPQIDSSRQMSCTA